MELGPKKKKDWLRCWDNGLRPLNWKELLIYWRDVNGISREVISDINRKVLGGRELDEAISSTMKVHYLKRSRPEKKQVELELLSMGIKT